MVVIIKALQVILALAILILIHEFGHFIFAKMFKIRIEKFYLFFDAGGFSLFKFKPKNSDTEYGIGWLPLGGYCKIAGMVDESLDKEQLKSEPQPWEFRSKPAWQRLMVMAGGVLFNFITAIILYIAILGIWGDNYYENSENNIKVNELAYDMGFRDGDRILAFDDYVPEDFFMLQADLVRNQASKAIVLRGEDTLTIYIDQSKYKDILNSKEMFQLAIPFTIGAISENSANRNGNLEVGDKIIGIGEKKVQYLHDAVDTLLKSAGQSIDITRLRGEDTSLISVAVDTNGLIGVNLQMPPYQKKEYNFLSAIPAGFRLTYETISGYVKDLGLIFQPETEAYKSVGSFIAMGQIFPETWNWRIFLNILALLSIMLGVMNLLPIPALDGGHMVFTLYEMITGKKPSDKFLFVMQLIGMIFIFGLMFLAFGNDIMRLIN